MPILCSATVALPTAALARTPHSGGAGSGGIGVTGGSGGSTTKPKPKAGAPVVRLTGVVNASGDGITLTAAASGTQNHPLTIRGDAPANDAGATIYIEAAKLGRASWSPVATAVIGTGGAFSARWIPTTSAQVELRAVLSAGLSGSSGGTSSGGGTNSGGGTSASGGSGLAGANPATPAAGAGSATAAAGPIETAPLTIPIFRNAVATIYGPGFWGHHTACGERLTRATLGVASRTLKCGTHVAVFYKGREITVPVIDRGPFANGASWDLTMATAKALGVEETVTVGTLSPAPAPAPAAAAAARA